jgi:hypothetical protein
MATVINKTIHSNKAFDFKTHPSMFKKTLSHHFFEQTFKKCVTGVNNGVTNGVTNGVAIGVTNGISNGIVEDVDKDVLLVDML